MSIRDPKRLLQGHILVITAGTSDIPVAEEARVTAEVMGSRVETLYDVGVAGIHRLLERQSRLMQARVVVVVAGMARLKLWSLTVPPAIVLSYSPAASGRIPLAS